MSGLCNVTLTETLKARLKNTLKSDFFKWGEILICISNFCLKLKAGLKINFIESYSQFYNSPPCFSLGPSTMSYTFRAFI